MNKFVTTRWVNIVLAIIIGLLGFAGLTSAEGTASETTVDIAKIYTVKHELIFDGKGTMGMLDGKKWGGDLPITQNGQNYVPLRILRDSGAAASMAWDPKKRQATIIMNTKLLPWFPGLIFQIGSNKLYGLDGREYPGMVIPKPILKGGKVYVPLKPLGYLGIKASTVGGKLTMSWSDKIVELLKPEWETDHSAETFTLLYQKDSNVPLVLASSGDGSWGGKSGNVIGRDIAMDGRLYIRVEFTQNLRIGANPLRIGAFSTIMDRFDIYRRAADGEKVPLNVTWEGHSYAKFTSPAGYLKAKAGASIAVEGSLLQPNPNFERMTLDIYKYTPGSDEGYQSIGGGNSTIEIRDDGVFAGSFALTEPGNYLITIISPPYLASSSGDIVSTPWADFVVVVE